MSKPFHSLGAISCVKYFPKKMCADVSDQRQLGTKAKQGKKMKQNKKSFFFFFFKLKILNGFLIRRHLKRSYIKEMQS